MAQPNKGIKNPFPYQLIVNIVFGITLIILVYWSLFHKVEKLAYIDTPKLLMNYKGMQDAQQRTKIQMQEMKLRMDTLISELRQMENGFKKDNSNVTKKESERRKVLLDQKNIQINQYRNGCSGKIESDNKKIRELIIKEINAFITQFAEKNGFACVISASANGGLIYAEKRLDITEEVLKGLNSSYVKSGK